VINGWAGLPTSRIPADFVILARAEDEGKVTAITAFTVTRERADVAKRQGTHKLLMSGFRRRLELVSDADDELIMLAVDESARQVFRLRRVPRR